MLAVNRAGSLPLSLGTGLGLSEDLRRMDPPLDRATNPAGNATTRIEWKGEDRLRGLVGAADLLLHQVAIDLGHLGTLEHEDRSRRKMLAEQRLKDPRRSDTPAAAGTDPAESERIAGERRAVGTRVESLSAEQVRGHRAIRELLDELAARQALFLRVVDAVRGSIEPAAPSREGSTAGTASRGTSAAPTTSRSIPQSPAADPFARRLKELEKLIRSERVAVDVDRALVWVDATLDGTHHLKMIVDSRAADMALAAGTAAAAGIRPLDGLSRPSRSTLEGQESPGPEGTRLENRAGRGVCPPRRRLPGAPAGIRRGTAGARGHVPQADLDEARSRCGHDDPHPDPGQADPARRPGGRGSVIASTDPRPA